MASIFKCRCRFLGTSKLKSSAQNAIAAEQAANTKPEYRANQKTTVIFPCRENPKKKLKPSNPVKNPAEIAAVASTIESTLEIVEIPGYLPISFRQASLTTRA